MARLVAESGSLTGKEWNVDTGVTLGREGHNTIPMPDNKKSSRDHAKVWRESPGKYSIADLGSTNGTLVNDEKVTRQPLVDGDEVRVGEMTFRFLLDDDEKPKKTAYGPVRGAEPLKTGAPGAPAAPAGSTHVPASSTITVKERILQYQKKGAEGSVAGWDLAQTGSGMRWLLYLIAAAVAVGLFFGVKSLM
jgi:predicted component of type VI protein secretion system